MRVGYRWTRSDLVLLSRRVALASLLLLPLGALLNRATAARTETTLRPELPKIVSTPVAPDPRVLRLKRYFTMLHCPVVNMAEDFIHAADDNHLDWRLLPAIAVIESGGGKAYINNNVFGWGLGGPIWFPSIRAGLHMVAFKLGQSSIYRDQDIPAKLRKYNPDASYPGRVLDVMDRISRVADLKVPDSAKLVHRDSEYFYVAN
jgi:hypothetical protein